MRAKLDDFVQLKVEHELKSYPGLVIDDDSNGVKISFILPHDVLIEETFKHDEVEVIMYSVDLKD